GRRIVQSSGEGIRRQERHIAGLAFQGDLSGVVDRIGNQAGIGVVAAKAPLLRRTGTEIRSEERCPCTVNELASRTLENVVLVTRSAAKRASADVLSTFGVQLHAKSGLTRIGIELCDEAMPLRPDVRQSQHRILTKLSLDR